MVVEVLGVKWRPDWICDIVCLLKGHIDGEIQISKRLLVDPTTFFHPNAFNYVSMLPLTPRLLSKKRHL